MSRICSHGRAAGRHREFAARAALGAPAWRLARLPLVEGAMVGVIAAAAGLPIGFGVLRLLQSVGPANYPRLAEASLDLRVFVFASAAALLSGVAAGVAPGIAAPRLASLSVRSGLRLPRLTHALLAVQIGVSVLLLSGAGLLLISLRNMQSIALGWRTDHVLAVRMMGIRPNLPDLAVERLRTIPGVREAALSDTVPLYGGTATMIYSMIQVEGRGAPDPLRQTGGMTVNRRVTPEYFRVFGIPILQGRPFSPGEEDVVILDERLARRMFPDEDPLGKRIRHPGPEAKWMTVVGVAKAVRNAPPTAQDDPEYYLPWQRGRNGGHVLLRTSADPALVTSWVREEMKRVDPTVPVTVRTMEDVVGSHSERPRFLAVLTGAIAALGLLLAAAGQYALISWVVTQRFAEIGIRMALGAEAADVVRLAVSGVTRWSVAGAVAGLGAAFWLGRVIEPLLFGVTARDGSTAAGVLALLTVVTMAAAVQPALRAVRVDPATALRHE